ncbi:1,2-phenylacetyl-CoA epoxidase subunit PaaD [Natrarchaeobius oligotrophus]|uniref:Metal-sulfur cluster assembly factor n=1 Tax=Natrarchaeobius chitinivorans TaxID=1679083 RepID=A0A3N6MC59_NATCH|nr:1,2-phenylacetyl-CoA epoxidase subunit PaaD [Natrarchaeobius chitinivorans]RQH01399.1 metal-sulfur cluster assembly factor [Natrarchaeobius chitinivorans]
MTHDGTAGVEGGDLDDEANDADRDHGSVCAYTEYRRGDESPTDVPRTGAAADGLEEAVWDALAGVEDPEMPIGVVDLGLIYDVRVDDGSVVVEMTLTYSGCPARTMLTENVEEAVAAVDGVDDVGVRLVWSPEWTVEMVSESGRDALREFGLSV